MDYVKIKFAGNFDPSGRGLGKANPGMFRPRPVNPMFSSREHLWTPQMDIFETSEEIMIWAEISGVEKDDLDLEINSRAVKVSVMDIRGRPAGKSAVSASTGGK